MAKLKFQAMLEDDYIPVKKEKPAKKPAVKKKPKVRKKLPPLKACAKCGTKHRKSGLFCSYSCANSRTWTEEDKQKKREGAMRHFAKPESIAHREAVSYSNTLRNADELEDVEIEPYFSSNEHEDYLIDNEGDVWHDAND